MKNANPLVSVIIPCYNTAKFIAETIQSVIDQTHDNLDIIIVNDGSTDNSVEVIQAFRDKRINLISQKNQGLSAARNTGIQNAKGVFINFLDADDVLVNNKIEKQVRFLEKNKEYGLVACNFIRTDEKGKYLYTVQDKEEDISPKDLYTKSQFPVHTALIKTEWIANNGWFDTDLRAAEDWDYYCRLSLLGCKMYRMDFAGCTYRLLDSAMTGNAPRQSEMLLNVVEKTFSNELMPSTYINLKNDALKIILLQAICRCFALGYNEEGYAYLRKLKVLKPDIENNNYDVLTRKFGFMVKHMQVTDYQEKITVFTSKAPKDLAFLKRLNRKFLFYAQVINSPNQLAVIIRTLFTEPQLLFQVLKNKL